MEAPGMTDDDVRDRFSAYHDRELAADEHERVRAALEASPALTKEYEDFCAMLAGLSNLAAPGDAAPPSLRPAGVPEVDLLAGVQRRIHKRSGGRFYRDRWSRAAGVFPLEWLAALVLVGLVVAYFAMTMVSVEPAGGPQAPAPTAPAR